MSNRRARTILRTLRMGIPRKCHAVVVAVAACVGLPAMTQAAAAQVIPAGEVDRIAEVLGFDERKIEGGTPLVRIRRAGGDAWYNASPQTDVFHLDSLALERYVDAQVKMSGPAYDGTLTFLPELIIEGRAQVYRADVTSPDALYNIVQPPGVHVGVDILRGALVVEWDEGRLEILAAGTRIDVLGTRLAVAVDSTGNAGFLYVQEGTVIFPDFPGTPISDGQVYNLQRGVPPTAAQPGAVQGSNLASAVDFNHSDIWSGFRPFYLKPFFYVPAAIVVGGVTTWAVLRDDNDRRGTVLIRIPFD